MSLEFKSYKLEDLGKIYSGGTPSTKISEYWNGDLNWLSSGETRDTYIYDTEKTITQEGADNSSTKLATKGDIVIASAGQGFTRGQASMVMIDTFVNQSVIVIHPNEKINNYYLLYNLKLRYNQLRQLSDHTSTRGSLTTKIIKDLDIDLPNLEIQNQIADIITIFDKKIRVNEQINHNLEQLAKSIYKHHFIDMKPYMLGGYIRESPLGIIPKDWSVQLIGEFVDDMKNGGTPRRGESAYWENGTIPWLKTGEINNNIILKSEEHITELGLKNSSAKLLPKNSIIMALYGKGTAARIGLLKIEATTNQACCAMICNDLNKTLFLYLFLLFNQKEIENLASGSVQQNLSKDLIANLNLIVPPIEIIENLPFKEIFDTIANNYFEIEYLTNLRDTLLPKLMSGEVDVSKINCDLKLYFIKFILKSIIQIWRYFNMKTKLISKIQNQMKPFLNQGQYLKLTNSLLNSFKDVEILDNNNDSNETDNFKLLNSFLSAKQVEGRSEKTIVYYKSTLEKMLAKVNKQVYNITTDDIRKYLFEHKQEKDSSKITIDNMRRIFSSFFSWLEDEDYILKNPVRRIHRVKTGRVVKEVLTDENLEVLRDNCEEIRDLAIVEILISTGIRVGELVKLNIEDINFYERECVVFGKGESERVVYFDARTKIHLLEYLESRTDENPALFVSLNKPHERLGISGVETRLRELGNKCNIPKVHPHKFRRTLATNAIDKGMPIEQVQKLLGHVQIDTTMQYAMVNQSNVKIAHRKFIS